jgi:hypothetical protein
MMKPKMVKAGLQSGSIGCHEEPKAILDTLDQSSAIVQQVN